MASTDASPSRIKSPNLNGELAPPIGTGSVETKETDFKIIREPVLPKWYVESSTGGFPQRTLPPLFPPSIPPGHDATVKGSYLSTPVEAHPIHPFIFHEERPCTSSGKSPSSAERPQKRKRCSGLSKSDKLALITICTKHKADCKQGNMTGFWELVKKSMLAETGKDLAQPRSMIERWCNWEFDQTLERQTTDDQQDFRIAVKEFCVRWRDVRQEYHSRRQSKANTIEEAVGGLADQSIGDFRTSSYGHSDESQRLRLQYVPGEIEYPVKDISGPRTPLETRPLNDVFKRSVSDSNAPSRDAAASNIPSPGALAGSYSIGNTRNINACNGNFSGRSGPNLNAVTSRPLSRDAPASKTLRRDACEGRTSNDTVFDGNAPSGTNAVTNDRSNYESPYPGAPKCAGSASHECTNITPSSSIPNITRAEIAGASLPTPRASISGSQSSTSSPITSMDFRHFPQTRAENTRDFNLDATRSSARVMSSPIDDLAQAYVARTYEASFDILREIMTRHDEIVRRISASKALSAEDLEANKQHIRVVERELEDTRRQMSYEKGALTAQLEKTESERVAAQQQIDCLQRQKAEAVTKLHESQRQLQQLQNDNHSGAKQLEVQTNSKVEESQPQVGTASKKTAAEKELEACQRQIVKIKNEKLVLELELSVSKRQVQELKAQVPGSSERSEGDRFFEIS